MITWILGPCGGNFEVNPGYASGVRLLVHGGHHGPVGIFEIPDFATGTRQLAEALAASSAKTVIGGRDSVIAVKQLSLAGKMTFILTEAGASLGLLEGKELPGVAALSDR